LIFKKKFGEIAMYFGYQKHLMDTVLQYQALGYSMALSKGKNITTHMPMPVSLGLDWDGVSIIMDKLVCVDFDTIDLDIGEILPPTWKEKTRRGYHLFYRVPTGFVGQPKIGWKPNVDLLFYGTTSKFANCSLALGYGGTRDTPQRPWGKHVLVAPTNGYSMLYPEKPFALAELPMAPSWLLKTIGN
jgi:hypothetical protein